MKIHRKTTSLFSFSMLMGLIVLCFLVNALVNPGITQADEWRWPPSLIVMTKSLTSSSGQVAVSWGTTLEKVTGMKVRVIPGETLPVQARMLKAQSSDIWQEDTLNIISCLEGEGGHATRQGGPFQLRVGWPGMILQVSFWVRGDSPIKTMQDVKPGTRYALWVGSPTHKRMMQGFFAVAGLEEKDITVVQFGSLKSAVQSIAEGKADVTVGNTTSGLVVEAASNPHGIRFLDFNLFDKEALRKWAAYVPDPPVVLERGLKEARGKNGFMSLFFNLFNAEADPELVYHYAKFMNENYDAYKNMHPACETINLKEFRKYLDFASFPVHDGTIRYLKELGMWSAADDARQKKNVERIAMYVEAYQAAIRDADAKEIDVNFNNKSWIELWESYKKKNHLPLFGGE